MTDVLPAPPLDAGMLRARDGNILVIGPSKSSTAAPSVVSGPFGTPLQTPNLSVGGAHFRSDATLCSVEPHCPVCLLLSKSIPPISPSNRFNPWWMSGGVEARRRC